MKDLIFIIGLVVLIVVALKILFWAVSEVLVVALVVAAAYVVFRIVTARGRGGSPKEFS